MSEARTEWAIEITWRDWKAAGARGPTSQYGPFETSAQRDAALRAYRRDREITATRVLTRRATYTPWDGPLESQPTSETERQRLLDELYGEMKPRR